jgi:hypothetical protein
MSQRRAGLIQVRVNGFVYDAKGSWSYNLGRPKREAIIGADGVHGYKETPQVSFVEGEITDHLTLDLGALATIQDATVTLDLANGKQIVINDAWYAGEGTGNTEEGNIGVRFEGAGEGEENA